MNQLIGYSLISLPFIAVFLTAWRTMDFWSAVGVFALGGLIISSVTVGVCLLNG